MSTEARDWLESNPDADAMPAAQWAVMHRLAWHYSETQGGAWPGVSTLVKGTHLSRATVYRVLQELETEGWIERHAGVKTSTFYRLPRYAGEWASEADSHHETPSHHGTDPSRGETRKTRNTRKEDERQVKPGGFTQSTSITEGQSAFLADIYLMTSGHPWTDEERAREASMTFAEADEVIKASWSELEREGRARILARIPKPRLDLLGDDARNFLGLASAKRAA